MATLREHLAVTPRRLLLAIGRAHGVRLSWEAPMFLALHSQFVVELSAIALRW